MMESVRHGDGRCCSYIIGVSELWLANCARQILAPCLLAAERMRAVPSSEAVKKILSLKGVSHEN